MQDCTLAICDDLYTYIPYILGTDPMAAEEIGRNPVSNQQVTPEYGDEQADVVLRKASVARVNRRLLRYYLIVRRLPNVFALACRS